MTLVLLHALPFGGAMWQPVVEHLHHVDPEHAVLAPDLYELGDSLGVWADAVLDQVPSGPLVVVGCSVGGSCAIEVAIRAPSRVRALVLIGTKAGHRPEPTRRDEALDLLATEGVAAAWARWWAPLFSPDSDPDLLATARAAAIARGADAVARGVRAFHARPDRGGWPATASCPVTVVEGAHDRPARAAALAAELPSGGLQVVPDVGHHVPIEAPAVTAAAIEAAVDADRTR